MRFRLASIAFLLGSVSTGIAWLTLQPVIVQLIDAVRQAAPEGSPALAVLGRVRGLLPFYLGLDLILLAAACYAVLYLSVGRPVRRAEQAIDQLSRLELELPLQPSGGPLLSRLHGALKRMVDALSREQAVTRRQLADLKGTNDQLSLAHTELVASERLATVGKLAAGVAHEVGNPLAGILGYLSLAKSRGGQSAELIDLLDRIDAEVQRIDQIVRGLLDIGRPSQGMPVPVEVERIANAVVKLAAAGPDFAGVQVSLALEPGMIALAEPGPLSQVLLNLLINAAQAVEGKGAVLVSGRHEGARVVLEVKDSGPGIPSDALPRIFDPFFTTKAAGKGTGLGLAVSRHLVSAMGGEIAVENAPEGGARFVVWLPRVSGGWRVVSG